MKQKLFTDLLADWPSKPDEDLEHELRTMPASLLNWVLAHVLNDEEVPQQAHDWVQEGLTEAKNRRKGDLRFWRLVRWTSLCAVQELMGDSGEDAAQQAMDWIVPSSKTVKSPIERSELVACVIGLLNYFEEDDALSPWREKQLQQDWEGGEVSLFQSLYLSEAAASHDDIVQLSLETACASATVFDGLPMRYNAGLVLALARQARASERDVGEALREGVRSSKTFGRVSVEEPVFSLEKGGLSMLVNVKGAGDVLPLSFLFQQALGGFTRNFRRYLAGVADGGSGVDKKAVLAAAKDEDSTLTFLVKYDPKVDMSKATREALARRFHVAVAHARAWESKFRARAVVEFEEQAG